MRRFSVLLFLSLLFTSSVSAQQASMRPVTDLINRSDPGWPRVKQWIDSAKNYIEVLPADTNKTKQALFQTQVTTRSPLGSIIFSTAGILVDHGWLRILGGGGHRKLMRSLPEWNKGKTFEEFGMQPDFLLVADDAAGGYFAINYGAFGSDTGKVYYFSPDYLQWEPLELNYTEFLLFCFDGDLTAFYEGLRWEKWWDDLEAVNGSQVFNFFPPLWTAEARDINKVTRNLIPIEEQYDFNMMLRKKLNTPRPVSD